MAIRHGFIVTAGIGESYDDNPFVEEPLLPLFDRRLYASPSHFGNSGSHYLNYL